MRCIGEQALLWSCHSVLLALWTNDGMKEPFCGVPARKLPGCVSGPPRIAQVLCWPGTHSVSAQPGCAGKARLQSVLAWRFTAHQPVAARNVIRQRPPPPPPPSCSFMERYAEDMGLGFQKSG